MYSRTHGPPPGGFGLGLAGPVPRDIWVLLGIVFVTFTMQSFPATALLPELLRLGPAVWRLGFVWQLATYPFIGTGAPTFWFLLELLILFLFGRQVLQQLGRRRFWTELVVAAALAALVAVAVQLLLEVASGRPAPLSAFSLMQGQHMVLVILIAAFATLNRYATIYLFFVLPIQARWFLGLEILFAFMGFLASRGSATDPRKDLAGFVGVCAAVAITYVRLAYGGRKRWWREPWLRLQAMWARWRLARLRRRRGFRVVRGERDDRGDPWVH